MCWEVSPSFSVIKTVQIQVYHWISTKTMLHVRVFLLFPYSFIVNMYLYIYRLLFIFRNSWHYWARVSRCAPPLLFGGHESRLCGSRCASPPWAQRRGACFKAAHGKAPPKGFSLPPLSSPRKSCCSLQKIKIKMGGAWLSNLSNVGLR